MEPVANFLSCRAMAMLRAVADSRAEMTISSEPDLRVDGLLCCDQALARELAHAHLIRPVCSGRSGQWVKAVPTPTGASLLDERVPPAAA